MSFTLRNSSQDPTPIPAQDTRVLRSSAADYLKTPVVQIRVGKEEDGQKTFAVHEGLITSRSHFFRNALNGAWRESDTKTIPLEDVDPETFELYLNSLYFNRLPIIADDSDKETTGQFESLVRIYVLADRLMDPTTKNILIDAMICRVRDRKIPKIDTVTQLYDGTTEHDPMRRLFVDVFVKFGDEKCIAEMERTPEFMFDVVVGFMKSRANSVPLNADLARIDPAEYRCNEANENQAVTGTKNLSSDPAGSS